MNAVLKRKLNLLVHLARIDGNFHKSERDIIMSIVNDMQAINAVPADSDPFAGIDDAEDRDEILYLALKLAHADAKVTEEELEFCRTLAVRLGYPGNTIDHFVNALPDFTQFVRELKLRAAAG